MSPTCDIKGSFSPRICLVGISSVQAIHGVQSERVYEFVESGYYQWTFNLAAETSKRRPDLRFWKEELADRDAVRKSSLAEVLSRILPDTKATFAPGDVCLRWLIARPTLGRIRQEMGLRPGNLPRPALVKYLASRWIGNMLNADKRHFDEASASVCAPPPTKSAIKRH